MDIMDNFYQRFCKVGFDEKGVLNSFVPDYPENYNYGFDVVDAVADLDPDRKALLWCNLLGEERTFTFDDIRRASNQVANMFLAKGIKKGDKVMLILKRNYQFWFAIIALHKIGAVVIPATNLLTTKDLIYRFQAADVKAIVVTADCRVPEFVDEAQKQCPDLTVKMICRGTREGWIDFDTEMQQYPDTLERGDTHADDPMLMYFTSGTTGYPKMVLHDQTYSIGHIITALFWHNIKPGGLHLTVSETGWGKAVWGKLYGQWIAGATVFVYDFDKFVPKDLLEKIQQYKVTTFCAPPTIYRFLIKEDMSQYDLSSLTYATTAGEALNPEVFKKFYEYTGLKLMEGFGQTETTLLLANLAGTEPNPGYMGRPTPLYDVVLADENDEEVAPGVVGEICVRLKPGQKQVGVFMGYYRDPERTAQATRNNMYHTGDTAWKDEEGYFWYVGRIDDVIKASGYRIGPFEIESVLMEHPAVMECAVTGAPDPIRGQVVKATIVLTKGYTGSPELVKELQNYVKKQTAPYKYPRIVEFVDELPKTISGKIRRVVIREESKQKYENEHQK